MYTRLQRSQLKRLFFQCQELKKLTRPSVGWIRTIRTLYGMPVSFLARKMDRVQSRVSTVELSEKEDRLTLRTLRDFAHALNCDLVYGFVPREDPEDFLTRHAQQKAQEMVEQLQRTMLLENQAISKEELQHQYRQLVQELLDNPKKIWESI